MDADCLFFVSIKKKTTKKVHNKIIKSIKV